MRPQPLKRDDKIPKECKIPWYDEEEESTTFSTVVLPTLSGNIPGKTLTTPEGSSCAETITITDCAAGPGGQTACGGRASCASWVATTTQVPTPTTDSETEPTQSKTPLELFPPVCNDRSENRFKDHVDIDETTVDAIAEFVCKEATKELAEGYVVEPGYFWNTRRRSSGITFHITFKWVEGCITNQEFQFLDEFASCSGMLKSAWHQCKYLIVSKYETR